MVRRIRSQGIWLIGRDSHWQDGQGQRPGACSAMGENNAGVEGVMLLRTTWGKGYECPLVRWVSEGKLVPASMEYVVDRSSVGLQELPALGNVVAVGVEALCTGRCR